MTTACTNRRWTSERSCQIRHKNRFKSINSAFGKKIIDEGIKQVPNLYKYETSKIKNKNVRKVLDSDIAIYAVTEAQSRAKNNITNFFGGI